MCYLLDANTLIQAKNQYYGFDICPGYWDWLADAHKRGVIHSVQKVREEISKGKDELSAWVAGSIPPAFFLSPDTATAKAFGDVSTWVAQQGFDPAVVSHFMSGADYYLVSYALGHPGLTVVTHEVLSDSKKRIKIPNVCLGLKIPWENTFSMLAREKARFVLDPF